MSNTHDLTCMCDVCVAAALKEDVGPDTSWDVQLIPTEEMYPEPTEPRWGGRLQRWLKARFRYVVTRGPDAYAGGVWEFKIAGVKVGISDLIDWQVTIGRKNYHKGLVLWVGKLIFCELDEYRIWQDYKNPGPEEDFPFEH